MPTNYIMMLGLPAQTKARHDLSRVGKLLVSSAPARKDTKLAILELFPGGRLFELYGSTEAGWVTILRPDEQIDHLGSVGREWAGSGAIRLLDHDGNEVPDGEVGELYSRTAYVFCGYWKSPEATAACFIEIDGKRFFRTGDLGRMDEEGYFFITARLKRMINASGFKVWPSEVELLLFKCPLVQEACVIASRDAYRGDTVKAVVVLRAEHERYCRRCPAWQSGRDG